MCRNLNLAILLLVIAPLGLAGSAWAAPPAPAAPAVTLPDDGTYYWWVGSPSGTIESPPKVSTGTAHLAAGSSLAAGDTLYVLDKHTGYEAAVPVTKGATPITLRIADFHPVGGEAPAQPTPTAAATPAKPDTATAATSPTPPQGSDTGALVGRVVTWIFGLVLVAAIAWFLRQVVVTRGQPLIAGARKLGVDVPDPTEIALSAQGAHPDGQYVPLPPPMVEAVPEEALPPPPEPQSAGFGSPASSFSMATSPRLVGLDGPAAGQRFDLSNGSMTVGRDAANTIVIADPSISRRHATLQEEVAGYVIKDEGSANGVYVNGQRVSEQPLQPGDTVQIGRVRFRFEDR